MKYNDNGEYKDIYIKTFDTLPVGTEVDYDGETVPDGWTQVNDVLFTSANGTIGNITLSDNVSNYRYLEITFKSNPDADGSAIKTQRIKVDSSNKKFILDFNVYLYGITTPVFQIASIIYSWNNNILTENTSSRKSVNINGSNTVSQAAGLNNFAILEVVGYK